MLKRAIKANIMFTSDSSISRKILPLVISLYFCVQNLLDLLKIVL